DDDFLGEIGAENVVAQVAFGARLLDGVLQNPRALLALAQPVDEALGPQHRVSGDENALDQKVRVELDEHAVVERARLAFVPVARQVPGPAVVGQKAPLDAGREARAAAPAQIGLFHFRLHVLRRHLLQRLAQRGVAALRLVVFNARQIDLADALGQHAHFQRVGHLQSPSSQTAPGLVRPISSDNASSSAPSRSRSMMSLARSGVTLWKYSWLICSAG